LRSLNTATFAKRRLLMRNVFVKRISNRFGDIACTRTNSSYRCRFLRVRKIRRIRDVALRISRAFVQRIGREGRAPRTTERYTPMKLTSSRRGNGLFFLLHKEERERKRNEGCSRAKFHLLPRRVRKPEMALSRGPFHERVTEQRERERRGKKGNRVEDSEKRMEKREGERAKGPLVGSRMDGDHMRALSCHPPWLSSVFRIIDRDYFGLTERFIRRRGFLRSQSAESFDGR